ncbi:ROK family transcriptional regulator [Frigoribacterium sp. VKM Ac-2836]|uniref:ROK family transcriptional regulator n=1 Tax=Frigoribacterium sp. VKM Ac-2836 TaxID=2739014 RepID=UPI001562F04D|nr:ROK family transcriptional regulator [Frigoribacterium sp. VKM Ac-2836]NRD25287.1 ROK family transcriptional regulator [Frigoribacterium sp. VKM Ac-2836]
MSDTTRSSALGSTGASEIFQLLRDGAPRTRAELAAMTGLARSTIGLRLDVLAELGLVGPYADAVSTGGRPPSRVALVPSARVVLAADFGAGHVNLALTDLMGVELTSDRRLIDIADGPETTLGGMVTGADALLDRLGRTRDDLIGVGIGLPGPVQFSTGRPVNPPIMPGWDGFDVPGWVRRHLDVPVLVDNDVNIMALGERSHAWPSTDHFLFVKVATGIGSGIISGGRLQRGAQGIAGDIGHVQIPRGAGVVCHCGNIGCLEAVASGPALARSLRALGYDCPGGRQVVELVRAGNVDAVQAVRQAGRDLGEVLTACVNMINPSVIAIGGSMAQAGEHLLAGVREVVYQRSMPLATEHLGIVPSRAGDRAGLMGASMLAIHHALSPAAIDELAAAV